MHDKPHRAFHMLHLLPSLVIWGLETMTWPEWTWDLESVAQMLTLCVSKTSNIIVWDHELNFKVFLKIIHDVLIFTGGAKRGHAPHRYI